MTDIFYPYYPPIVLTDRKSGYKEVIKNARLVGINETDVIIESFDYDSLAGFSRNIETVNREGRDVEISFPVLRFMDAISYKYEAFDNHLDLVGRRYGYDSPEYKKLEKRYNELKGL